MLSLAMRFVVGFVLLLLVPMLSAQEGATQWTSLFDGKTLNGWVVKSGFADFAVEDGCIVGTSKRGSPNTFLCTKRLYGDFIFEAEFRVDPRMNSGIQFRSELIAGKFGGRVNGYQYEIDSSKRSWTAGIFDERRRGWIANLKNDKKARAAFRRGEWNHCRIVAKANSLKTFINGVPASDHVDTMSLRGFFGLQVHGTNSKVPLTARWRNLRIQELGNSKWTPLPLPDSERDWGATDTQDWKMDAPSIRGIRSGSEAANRYLFSKKDRGDFVLRFVVRPRAGRSAFLFHSVFDDSGQCLQGLQVMIDSMKGIGDVYSVSDGKVVAAQKPNAGLRHLKAGKWNSVVVSAVAGRVSVHVNDFMAVDVLKVPGLSKGQFALQLTGGQSVDVEFRSFERLVTDLK